MGNTLVRGQVVSRAGWVCRFVSLWCSLRATEGAGGTGVRATEGVRVMWKGLIEERVGPRQSFRRIRTSRARFVVYDIVV